MKEEEIKKLNIYEKLMLITDEIGIIEKKLDVSISKTNSYKAVSERDVLDKVKPIEKNRSEPEICNFDKNASVA